MVYHSVFECQLTSCVICPVAVLAFLTSSSMKFALVVFQRKYRQMLHLGCKESLVTAAIFRLVHE